MSLRQTLLNFALAASLCASHTRAQSIDSPLRVPAFTAYFQPDPDQGPRRESDGRLEGWTSAARLEWFGRLSNQGELSLALELAGVTETDAALKLSVTAQGDARVLRSWTFRVPNGASAVELPVGRVSIAKPGYFRFSLESTDKAASALPSLRALTLDGPAAKGAHFSNVERRNASSVHLGYSVPAKSKDEIEWFYLELTPKTEPLHSYYMATGFSRGYFGMQVNSKTERRLIFSVWDAGKEATDRSKVADDNRVQLIAKGEDVFAGGFGNEGTGGRSHLTYAWKLGDTFRFLLRASPGTLEESSTTYSAWFFFPQTKSWGLIATFRAPRDGRFLHGLHSFNENFGGSNGDQRRICEFGNGWVRTHSGEWIALDHATFTHDGHGDEQRLDRSAGVIDGRFYLANGGFVDDERPGTVTKAYDKLVLKAVAGEHPSNAQLEALVEKSGH
ncbi:MAG: DUF3472 domain-containing protein [Gemmatimonas sp.]